MTTYNIVIERDEAGFWVASVREVKGCHSQGRSIQQARERIREALGLFVESADTADLVEHFRLPREARALVGKTKAARAKASVAVETAQESTQETVLFLARKQKMSVRDVGELLGLSHQRVQQLLA